MVRLQASDQFLVERDVIRDSHGARMVVARCAFGSWKEEINYGVMKPVSGLFKMRFNCKVARELLVVNEWTIK